MSRYAYQNLNERIEKLKKHLKTRRGRRDLIALGTLADIQHELAGRLTYDQMNAMMRCYYNEEASMFRDVSRRLGESPFYALMKKEGVKYEPVSFLPEKPMSYTYDEDPPIKTHAASKAYRDNYDRVFGEKKHVDGCIVPGCPGCDDGSPSRCPDCCGTGCVVDPDTDPAAVETEGDMLRDCPRCHP